MKPSSSRIRFEEIVLVVLLAFVPILFSRVTAECFEIPQTMLLATGALLFLWGWLAAALAAALKGDPGRLLTSLGSRALSGARRDPLGAGVILFLASSAASTIASPNPAQSVHGAPDSTAGLVTACATSIVYFMSRGVSRGHALTLVRFARAAGFASAVTASYAIIQLAGLDPLVWARTATFGGDVRVFGTLGHPNMLGAYLGMTVPLTGWLAIRTRSGIERTLWALVATVSIVVIAATLSRGAWIGLGAAAVAWAFLRLAARGSAGRGAPARSLRRSSRIPTAALASLLAIAAAALLIARSPMGPNLATRVREIANLSAPTTQSRLHIWRAGLGMARDEPVLGVGLDAFGTMFPRYRTSAYWQVEWGRTPNKAHNEAIQILATQGILGGISALLVILFAAAAIWRATRRGDPAAREGAVAAGASLVGFAVQDLSSFTVVALGSLAAALAGWLSAAGSEVPPARQDRAPRARRDPAQGWPRILAGLPVAAFFVVLVILPIGAQVHEKSGATAEPGSPARANAFLRASTLAPWDSRYDDFLGSSLLVESEREPNAARELLRRADLAERSAIRTEPQNGYYYANLGRIAAARTRLKPPEGSIADVQATFQEAVARDTVNAQIMDQASNALMQVGDAAQARAIALRSATLYPDLAQPMAFLGYAALMDQRWQDAADTLEIAVKRQWRAEKAAMAAAWSNLAAAYLALGRNEDARRAAESGVALDPRNSDAAANLKIAIARRGEDIAR
jgi:O-antigen ligase/Flp pilus assembly protein TadD